MAAPRVMADLFSPDSLFHETSTPLPMALFQNQQNYSTPPLFIGPINIGLFCGLMFSDTWCLGSKAQGLYLCT